MVTAGPLKLRYPLFRNVIVPTAISPTGGATARGRSGGTNVSVGTGVGRLRLGIHVRLWDWGAAGKRTTRSRPSLLTTGEPSSRPGVGSTVRRKLVPLPSNRICSRPSAGNARAWGPTCSARGRSVRNSPCQRSANGC